MAGSTPSAASRTAAPRCSTGAGLRSGRGDGEAIGLLALALSVQPGRSTCASVRTCRSTGAVRMLRYAFVFGLLATMLTSNPAFAVTKQQKLETCTFGADDQKLTGRARKTFMTRCMANEDRPAARTAPQQQK